MGCRKHVYDIPIPDVAFKALYLTLAILLGYFDRLKLSGLWEVPCAIYA